MSEALSFRSTTTFRKGKTETWKGEFTPDVVECFKDNDPGWLVKLGFEKDNSWRLPMAM